jgi:hypothetical protein
MHASDQIEMKGRVEFQLLRADGSEDRWEIDNLVVTTGKTVIADRMKAVPAMSAMTHMSIGTGGTAPAVGDAALAAEIARVALAGTAVAAAVITYTASFGVGIGTGAVVEAGLFNSGAGGQMLARTTFPVVNKQAGDILNVTWTVTVGSVAVI